MSAETQAAPREQQRPEYLQFSPNHITGLQARLALGGDALNPSMTFDRQITPDMVPDFQDRDPLPQEPPRNKLSFLHTWQNKS